MLFFQSGMEITLGGWSAQFAARGAGAERGAGPSGPVAVLGRDGGGPAGADPAAAVPAARRSCSRAFLASRPGGGRPAPGRAEHRGGRVGLFLLGFGLAAGFPIVLGLLGELYSDLTGHGVQRRLRHGPAGRERAALPDRRAGRPVGLRASLLIGARRRSGTRGLVPCSCGGPGASAAAEADPHEAEDDTMLALEWLEQARGVMDRIEATQTGEHPRGRPSLMADVDRRRAGGCTRSAAGTRPSRWRRCTRGSAASSASTRWWSCPSRFFTHIVGEMGVRQFVFLEGVEGYGDRIMEGYDFDPRDTMWIFSHIGNQRGEHRRGAAGQASRHEGGGLRFGAGVPRREASRHSSGKKLFEIADVVVDNCTDADGRLGPDQEPPGQDRAGLDHGVRDPGLDDHRDRGRDPRGAGRDALISTRRTTCRATPPPTSGSTRRCASTSGGSRACEGGPWIDEESGGP